MKGTKFRDIVKTHLRLYTQYKYRSKPHAKVRAHVIKYHVALPFYFFLFLLLLVEGNMSMVAGIDTQKSGELSTSLIRKNTDMRNTLLHNALIA